MINYWDTTGDPVTDEDLQARFDAMLDETYSDVRIGELTYSTSYAMRETDPVAYRCALADWVSAEIDDEALWEDCWLVGSNDPGCLPDNEPAPHPSFGDAWVALTDDLREAVDAYAHPDWVSVELGEPLPEHVVVESERVLALIADPPESGEVVITAMGREWWIVRAEA